MNAHASNQHRVENLSASYDEQVFQDTPDLLYNFSAFSNNLLNLSASLLAILTTLSQQKNPENLPELHQYLLRNIKELHNRGLQSGYSPRMMEKACYALCAAFDEEIMNTEWGQAARWENHSLVAQLFQQRNAGEVFFTLLAQARQNVTDMIDLIELMYFLLRLGFCGRYQNNDKHALAELVDSVYQEICQHRDQAKRPEQSIVCKPWKPLKQPKFWRLLPVILVILILTGIGTHTWIRHINTIYDDDLQWLQRSPSMTIDSP